jgi:hypothetical protein
MHWHINTNKYRIHTFWTFRETWKRAALMEDARRESNLPYMVTVQECNSLECLIDALAC